MDWERLDVLAVESGLFESRERARAAIMSGTVYVNGQREIKPGAKTRRGADVELRGQTMPYVSRGGLKLEKALESFSVSPGGKVCIDCGASTGGFTDCLLKNGAEKVYTVDVGYGQLAWSLRSDPRVIALERTNIRFVTEEQIPDRPALAVIDVSFISLALVLPVVSRLLAENGEAVCLIKPQFEAGRDKVGKKGVVREAETHVLVLKKFISDAENSGFSVEGLTFSPVKGPEGNIEYLGYLTRNGGHPAPDVRAVVELSHAELG